MAKQYYRKSNPPTKSETSEWIKMDGQEFYHFIKSKEGAGRCFIDFGDFVIESTKEQHKAWKKEQNRSYYLNKQAEKYIILSLYSDLLGEDVNTDNFITDKSQSTEDMIMDKILLEQIHSAICRLTSEERWVLEKSILQAKKKTLRQLSLESGIPVMTLCDRRKSAIEKIKKFISL
ncbi:MAG: hypothetical protein VB090_01540 [Petrimonas sp.]|nr:hypothetical protein [Petrimonas sp.]